MRNISDIIATIVLQSLQLLQLFLARIKQSLQCSLDILIILLHCLIFLRIFLRNHVLQSLQQLLFPAQPQQTNGDAQQYGKDPQHKK